MGLVWALPAHAMLFTLRPHAVLSRQPSYKTVDRLPLNPDSILVEGPALEQRSDFCLYKLFDQQGKPLSQGTAWTPCHSIDKLFIAP